jgi:hypothetical protein
MTRKIVIANEAKQSGKGLLKHFSSLLWMEGGKKPIIEEDGEVNKL